jgi:hypothetical protein
MSYLWSQFQGCDLRLNLVGISLFTSQIRHPVYTHLFHSQPCKIIFIWSTVGIDTPLTKRTQGTPLRQGTSDP